jgi:hypothetical protein
MTSKLSHRGNSFSFYEIFRQILVRSIRHAPLMLLAWILFGWSISGAYAVSFAASADPTSSNGIRNCTDSQSVSPSGANANASCGDTNGSGTAASFAAPGKVGAQAEAQSFTNFGSASWSNMEASAAFSSSAFVFTPLDGSDVGFGDINVALNLTLHGSGSANAAGAWSVFAVATVESNTVLGIKGDQNGWQENHGVVSLVNAPDDLSLKSIFTPVPLGQGVSVFIYLDVIATALGYPGNANVDFANTLLFPIGVDVFDLPAGYTVNNPEAYIFNNRFIPPNATPLPSTFVLFGSGLSVLGLLSWRRKRKNAAA